MVKIINSERAGKDGKLAVGCSAAVFDENDKRILLIRRADNGKWAVPGGYMEAGENFAEVATPIMEIYFTVKGFSIMKPKRHSQSGLLAFILAAAMFLVISGVSVMTYAQTGTPASTFIYLPLVSKPLEAFGPSSRYGRHYPNGIAAVEYIFSSEGMWKEINPAEYIWNYYVKCAKPNHPYGYYELNAAANGARFFTAGDADCHLLLDWNQDGEIDTTSGGYAFHEHNGKGVNGQSTGAPFTVFWFDDNWLARYLTEAYNRPAPNGLIDYPDFTRWRILGFDNSNWTPYLESNYPAQHALNGVYYLSTNDVRNALKEWDRIRDLSGFTYDADNQRYTYPDIRESYQLGLFEVLTGFLLDNPSITSSKQQELLSHWVALRSNILSSQERSGSNLSGWRSQINGSGTLINTESIAANVLGLGAGAVDVFEAGKAPLQMSSSNYFVRPHNVLSAVQGLSGPGYMTYGPDLPYPAGSYLVDFLLRAPSPTGTMATIDVVDTQSHQILAAQDVLASSMTAGNGWTRITLSISVTNSSSSLAFRTYWYGTANMDIAAIRVRKP